jgi:hypothetical protein
LSVLLEGTTPSIDIAGDYTMTITADNACPDLPSEARARTYTASMSRDTPTTSRYSVRLGGAALYDDVVPNWYAAGTAGDYFEFRLVYPEPGYAGYLPGVVEEIGANTYVAFSGIATATVMPASTISADFDGWITYCTLKSPLVSSWGFQCDAPSLRADPTPSRPVTYARCDSKSHRMTLARR